MPVVTIEKPAVLRLSPLTIDPPLPTHPGLREAIDDLIARTNLSLCMVAAESQPRAAGGVDQVFRSYLSSRKPAVRQRYTQRAQSLLAATESTRSLHFGRYATLSRTHYEAAGSDGLRKQVTIPKLDPEAIRTALQKQEFWQDLMAAIRAYREAEAKKMEADADAKAGAAFKRMKVFVHHVHCFEDTSEWGADEIALGGVVTDPFGNTGVVKEFMVSDDFDKGETAAVDRVFASWTIDTGPGWPHVYAVMIAMAEKDDGGFWEFLKALWDKVAPEVKELIATGLGAAIGGVSGGLWGALAGAVVGAIVGFIINAFDNPDDILGAKTLVMTLAAATKSYYDWAKLTAAGGWPFLANYYGDGGHYSLNGYFKVYTQ